jgi:hypothetical protein
MRINGFVIGTLILSMLLNWFTGSNLCANYALAWFGTPSVVLVGALMAWAALYVTTPRRRKSGNVSQVLSFVLCAAERTCSTFQKSPLTCGRGVVCTLCGPERSLCLRSHRCSPS